MNECNYGCSISLDIHLMISHDLNGEIDCRGVCGIVDYKQIVLSLRPYSPPGCNDPILPA